MIQNYYKNNNGIECPGADDEIISRKKKKKPTSSYLMNS